jgi:hypothetical protein
MIVAGTSVACLAVGVAMSYGADAHPRRQKAMETAAGVSLIVGFGLLGYLIESLLGAP